jgi:hypothetical protein
MPAMGGVNFGRIILRPDPGLFFALVITVKVETGRGAHPQWDMGDRQRSSLPLPPSAGSSLGSAGPACPSPRSCWCFWAHVDFRENLGRLGSRDDDRSPCPALASTDSPSPISQST